jgi:hypothetical protein
MLEIPKGQTKIDHADHYTQTELSCNLSKISCYLSEQKETQGQSIVKQGLWLSIICQKLLLIFFSIEYSFINAGFDLYVLVSIW